MILVKHRLSVKAIALAPGCFPLTSPAGFGILGKMRLNLNKTQARRTHERALILDQVHTFAGHFSAEDLLYSLGRGGHRVSRATVYRTLDLLVRRGMLQRVQLGDRGGQYEVIRGRPRHAHLFCLKCGWLADYPLAILDKLPQEVRRKAGFEAEDLLLRLSGYCKRCRRQLGEKEFRPGFKSKSGGIKSWEK